MKRISRQSVLWQRASLALFSALFLLLPTMGVAQSTQKRSLPPLKKSDLKHIQAVRSKLQEEPPGSHAEWLNEETGNKGTLTLLGKETLKDYPCAKIKHKMKIKSEAQPTTYQYWSCKVGDSWKTLTSGEVKKFREAKQE